MKTYNEPSDKALPELIRHALQAVKMWQQSAAMKPRVIFKHTCSMCGQRGFMATPNTVPEKVKCETCGNVEPYKKGGYSLAFELAGTAAHGDTTDKTPLAGFDRPAVSTVTKQMPRMTPDLPVKIGCRCEPDGTITPVDRDALRQFVAASGGAPIPAKAVQS